MPNSAVSESPNVVLEALRHLLLAPKEMREWGQGIDSCHPAFKFCGPWPQPTLIRRECDKLRAAYERHGALFARLEAAQGVGSEL